MVAIPSLPVFDVYIAFNPTASGATMNTAYSVALPSSGSSNSYWTNVSQYLMNSETHDGRQHFLDRMEAGTFKGTFNGRDGFFWNGTVNATGYTVAPRMPIAVTETWSGTTYRRFFGFIDSVKEQITDQLNSDVLIEATDQLKQLSLRKMESPQFWAKYAHSTSAVNHYSPQTTQTAVITQANGTGTTITYTGFNNFSAGMTVTITGLANTSGASLNLNNVVVASANAYQFTVTNSTVGTSAGGGSAYNVVIPDQVSNTIAYVQGVGSFQSAGAIIYTNSGCLDLANGSSAGSAYLSLGLSATTYGGIDFWVLGSGLAGADLLDDLQCNIGGTNYGLTFGVSATGYPYVQFPTLSSTKVTSSLQINDGYWHHVGVICDSSSHLQLYVDGQFSSLSGIGTVGGIYPTGTVALGGLAYTTPGLIDEIVVSNLSSPSTLGNEVLNRYVAGTLLQKPVRASGASISSGDRIAEILCLAGYGSITGGALTLDSNLYYINNGSAWSGYSSSNGFIPVQPFYWDAPVFDASALDLIYEVCDTDIGRFYQKGDGTFAFHNQKFFGTWEWDTITALSSTSTTFTVTAANTLSAGETVVIAGCVPQAYNGVWTVATASSTQFTVTSNINPGTGTYFGMVGGWAPNSYSPTGDHAWSDDASTNYPYHGPTLDAPYDEADVWTEVIVTPQAGVDQIFENQFAQSTYGYNTLTKSGTLHASLTQALSTACYLGVLFRSPLQRVQSVTLLSETANGSNNGALVNCQIDQVVSFKRVPPNASGAGSISRNMVVEARTANFDSSTGEFSVTYTLDPYPIRG